MPSINQAKVLILATDGYERAELRVPLEQLKQRGAEVKIASPKKGEIRSWDVKDWGDSVPVDLAVSAVEVGDFDVLVLPGGQINPDKLRHDDEAMRVVKEFLQADKLVAAICHAPWLLIEADALRGRTATSYWSIKTDVKNAGANWRDETVVVDGKLITSRCPDDLPVFVDTIVAQLEKQPQRAAA
jgi:protease I